MAGDGVTRLLVFRVGAELFGVDLHCVDEVIDLPVIRRLPDAPPTVLGVASVRGELVTVFDPRAVLQVAPSSVGAALLFNRGGRLVGLAVHDVLDVVTVEHAMLRTVPGVATADGMMLGLVRRGSNLIAALDADALIDMARTQVEAGGAASET